MTATQRRRGARIATLVAGGLAAALLLVATTAGALVGLGAADVSQRRAMLPDGVTAIEVHAEEVSINIIGTWGPSADRVPSVALRGVASSALGRLPAVDIELRGTTAIITPDETLRSLAFGPNSMDILLGDLALERIDVVTRGYVSIQHVDAVEIHATSLHSMVQVGGLPATGLTLLEVASNAGTQITLPESGGPYDVQLPGWFGDDYVSEWWQAHYGLDYRTEVLGNATSAPIGADRVGEELIAIPGAPTPTDGPGVFVPTTPGAPVTIDLRGVTGGMLQVLTHG